MLMCAIVGYADGNDKAADSFGGGTWDMKFF